MTAITTERMIILPISTEELKSKIEKERSAEMKQAYSEMLAGCINHPEQHLWYTVWMMQLKEENRPFVGDLCFKGLNENGTVEIGYGIYPEYEGRGLATEAVIAVTQWASEQPGVLHIEAETDPHNIASQKVLQKAGFLPSGVIGEEGPRFEWKNSCVCV
ncbi:MAG: GNAT family N-acetyltransferase [Oscillibacter sp.]|nr:GNAT family N-acetyltransferase [Oscillibacter sp.]